MAAELVGAVIRHFVGDGVSTGLKLTLVVLADAANKDTHEWAMSYAEIARRCGYKDDSQAIRNVRWLAERNLIGVGRRRENTRKNKPNVYRVNLEAIRAWGKPEAAETADTEQPFVVAPKQQPRSVEATGVVAPKQQEPRSLPSHTKNKPLSAVFVPDSVLGYWQAKAHRAPTDADTHSLHVLCKRYGADTVNLAIGQAVAQGATADTYGLITAIAKAETQPRPASVCGKPAGAAEFSFVAEPVPETVPSAEQERKEAQAAIARWLSDTANPNGVSAVTTPYTASPPVQITVNTSEWQQQEPDEPEPE